VVPTSEVAARLGVDADALERATGVSERRFADRSGSETASAMGALAARSALSDAGMSLADVDLIVNASGTVEQTIPDGGALLQRALGLGRSGVPALSVHATCLSFLAALDTVANAVALGRARCALIVSSDIGSAGIDWEDAESAGLFGDAAAAVVIVPSEETSSAVLASRFATFGEDASLAEVRGGGTRQHPNDPSVTRKENLFHMEGPRLLRRVLGRGRPFLEALQKEIGDEIDMSESIVIPHQASIAGLHMLRAFGIEDARVVTTLGHFGNCVAASIPLTLVHAVESGRLRRGELALLCGTGAGLSLGAIAFRY
jgi:3-oxoacyl-[acyl-carrier-protein] synthase-3